MTPTPTGSAPKPSSPQEPRRFRQYLWPPYRQILKWDRRPILVGPWRGEVGFEALYWLPFLDRLRAELGIPAARLIPISRGGAVAWYRCPVGLELYAMRDPQAVRIANVRQQQATGLLKQTAIDAFDRDVIRDAAKTLGLGRGYRVLHPAWMYHTLAPFWQAKMGLGWVQRRLQFSVLDRPNLPAGVVLPDRFVAVRFYARPTFPPTPAVTEFCRETLKQLTQVSPVILLNSGVHADEHQDFDPNGMPGVTRLTDYVSVTPETNLALQSAVLSRAMGFVGTYGGLAQLALRFQRPSISVYEAWHSTALPHRHLSEALALQLGIPFSVVRIGDLAVLQQALPRVTISPAGSSGGDLPPPISLASAAPVV